ncbi:MAG: DUF1287 domain-containing protein [Nevskiaceae bacterium]|jgi:uncharacterized protein YijF (DUF1287 family)|nr:DUF1287 domain-containing protein [Nevskiaceae bacterium]
MKPMRNKTNWLLALGAVLIWAQALAAPVPSLVTAARAQVGVTVTYDPAYVRLGFPGGDVPADRGVCTDVIIRAYRVAHGFDLQQAVNADMRAHFSVYPGIWGLRQTDVNIDHRRVPNLQVFFKRTGQSLPTAANPAIYQPGDLVTQMLPGNLPHIGIVSDRKSADGVPLVIHNIGSGVREEEGLFSYPITGHYRFSP